MKNVRPNNRFWLSLAVVSALLFLPSCSGERRESLTSGNLTMITAEDVYPVINIQVTDFQRMYEEVKILNLSSSTRDAFVQLLNDSVRLVVCARQLNAEERSAAVANKFEIDSATIAYDGVAVIVNAKNALQRLTTAELSALVSGQKKSWSEVKESRLQSSILVAAGDPNSGVHEFVRSRLSGGEPLTAAMFPCSSTAEVFSVVADRPNAIGFVGTAWLSRLPENVRVLEIGDPNFRRDTTSTALEYFAPHQAHIYRKYYPLSRTISIFSKNIGKGVGFGFTAFAASGEGQKIIVSNGLVPATMPVRLVQLSTP